MKITEYKKKEPNVSGINALTTQQMSLADGLELQEDAILCAWFEAFGMLPSEIELELNKPAGAVINLRRVADYQILLQRCRAYITSKKIAATQNPEELFNQQIGPSVQALIEVRDNPLSKGGDRIKASIAFLDRAPKAPKVRKEVDERHLVISLPLSDLQNMQQALIEEGSIEDKEIYDLLENKDYAMSTENSGNDCEETEAQKI